MKRYIALALLVCSLLLLIGCADQEPVQNETATGTFRVGFGRADITPLTSVPMAGYGNTEQRMSTGIMDYQYATCLAITDENEHTILVIALDQQRASYVTMNAVRPMINRETGIPEGNILISASHTHSGPDLNQQNNEAIIGYMPYMNEQVLKACQEALADRKPTTIEAGSIETEGMNFVRHYSYVDDNGQTQYFGNSFGTKTINDTTMHVTEADPTMHVVRFTQEGGQEIVLSNWRAHTNLAGKGFLISSDYVATYRDSMEAMTGCKFVFFQGACGNINGISEIRGECQVGDNNERGSVLAQYTIECLENNMEPLEAGEVKLEKKMLELNINHELDAKVTQARQVQSVFVLTNDNAIAIEEGKPYGIRSPYHAGAIITRSKKAATESIEIVAVSIGDSLSFTMSPNELFDDLTEYMEENSPYKYTLFFGYANGYAGYIPTAYGFEYTCYESDTCWFEPGCGEAIRDTMLELLDKTWES